MFKIRGPAPGPCIICAFSWLCINSGGDTPRTFTFDQLLSRTFSSPWGYLDVTAGGCYASLEGEPITQTPCQLGGNTIGFVTGNEAPARDFHLAFTAWYSHPLSCPSFLYPAQSKVVVTLLVLSVFHPSSPVTLTPAVSNPPTLFVRRLSICRR